MTGTGVSVPFGDSLFLNKENKNAKIKEHDCFRPLRGLSIPQCYWYTELNETELRVSVPFGDSLFLNGTILNSIVEQATGFPSPSGTLYSSILKT